MPLSPEVKVGRRHSPGASSVAVEPGLSMPCGSARSIHYLLASGVGAPDGP